MRFRIISLLLCCFAFIDLCAAGTIIWIWRNKEWHHHLLRFLGHSWRNFLNLEGSSGNGFVSGVLVALFEIFAVFAIVSFLHGDEAVKERLRHVENASIALAVLFILVVLVYGTQFSWEVAKTTYQDHLDVIASRNAVSAQNQELSSKLDTLGDPQKLKVRIGSLEKENAELKSETSGPIAAIEFPIAQEVHFSNGESGYMTIVAGLTKKRVSPVDIEMDCNHEINITNGPHVANAPAELMGIPQRIGSDGTKARLSLASPAWTASAPLYVEVYTKQAGLRCTMKQMP
jgi:hypothetical protein